MLRPLTMIDLSLTDEQRDLRDMARDFAGRELAPIAGPMDTGDHGDAIRTAYLAMFATAVNAGLVTLLIPAEYGGGGGTCIDNVIVHEELGAVDAGLAGSLNLTACVPLLTVLWRRGVQML